MSTEERASKASSSEQVNEQVVRAKGPVFPSQFLVVLNHSAVVIEMRARGNWSVHHICEICPDNFIMSRIGVVQLDCKR